MKKMGGGKIWGACALRPQCRTATDALPTQHRRCALVEVWQYPEEKKKKEEKRTAMSQ